MKLCIFCPLPAVQKTFPRCWGYSSRCFHTWNKLELIWNYSGTQFDRNYWWRLFYFINLETDFFILLQKSITINNTSRSNSRNGCFQIQLSTAVFVATRSLRRDHSFHVEQHLYYLNIFKFNSLNLITLSSCRAVASPTHNRGGKAKKNLGGAK